MNIKYYRLLRIITSMFVIIMSIIFCSVFLCGIPRYSYENTSNSFFNEKENTLDYVAIGASGTTSDIFPAVIWNKYGITGNNYSIGASKSNMYIYMVREIQKSQKDCMLIIDLDGFIEDGAKTRDGARLFIDALPYGNDIMFDAIKNLDSEYQLEHIFPIIRYHNNITNFTSYIGADFRQFLSNITNETHCMKGAYSQLNNERVEHKYLEQLVVIEEKVEQVCCLEAESEKALYELLDYCRDSNIEKVLFINLPKAYFDEQTKDISYTKIKRAEYCKKIVEQYEYDYYNACDNLCGLTNDDFCDTVHMKQTGAVKFSEWLGKYLKDHYAFDEKSQEIIDDWDESSLQAYKEYGL